MRHKVNDYAWFSTSISVCDGVKTVESGDDYCWQRCVSVELEDSPLSKERCPSSYAKGGEFYPRTVEITYNPYRKGWSRSHAEVRGLSIRKNGKVGTAQVQERFFLEDDSVSSPWDMGQSPTPEWLAELIARFHPSSVPLGIDKDDFVVKR